MVVEASGKHNVYTLTLATGIVAPVEASDKHDRLGLGYVAPAPPVTKRRHSIDVNQHIEHKQTVLDKMLSWSHEWNSECMAELAAEVRVEPHTVVDYDMFCTKGMRAAHVVIDSGVRGSCMSYPQCRASG